MCCAPSRPWPADRPSAATCAGHVGAWIAHASNDPLVDFTTGGIATRDFWIARNGCSTTLAPVAVSPADCVEYQGCQPDLPVVWCVHTEGHSWPSMANCLDGGVCLDAGPAIWTFFARLPVACTESVDGASDRTSTRRCRSRTG